MNVWALFSDGTAEKVIITSIAHKDDEKGLIIRTTISDNDLKECAERSISHTYNYLLSRFPNNPALLRPISICVLGFSGKVAGNSAELAFSMALIAYLIEKEVFAASKSMPSRVAATGTISDRLEIEPVSGLKNKIHAAQSENIEKLFFPSENTVEELRAAAYNPQLVPVKTLEDVLVQLGIAGNLSPVAIKQHKKTGLGLIGLPVFSAVLIIVLLLFAIAAFMKNNPRNILPAAAHTTAIPDSTSSMETPTPFFTPTSTPISTPTPASSPAPVIKTQSPEKKDEETKDAASQKGGGVRGNQNIIINGDANVIYNNR